MVTSVGIDSGFSYMKAVSNDKEIIFLNVATRGTPRVVEGGSLNTTIEENLDLFITGSNGNKKHYWVGPHAARHGQHVEYIWEKDRFNSDYGRATFLTSLALLTEKYGQKFAVGTGLPDADYRTNLKHEYEKTIPGKYTVTFASGPLEGQTRNFEIAAVRVYQQGMGVFFDQVLDEKGNQVSEHPLLDKGVNGLIDMGLRTTNIDLFEDRSLLENYTRSIELGMSYVYRNIQNELAQKGITLEDGDVEKILWKDSLTYAGNIFDVKGMREQVFKEIAQEVYRKASEKWGNKILFLDKVYCGGGGGQAIFDYLPFDKKELVVNPQLSNAQGFKKAITAAIGLGKVKIQDVEIAN